MAHDCERWQDLQDEGRMHTLNNWEACSLASSMLVEMSVEHAVDKVSVGEGFGEGDGDGVELWDSSNS